MGLLPRGPKNSYTLNVLSGYSTVISERAREKAVMTNPTRARKGLMSSTTVATMCKRAPNRRKPRNEYMPKMRKHVSKQRACRKRIARTDSQKGSDESPSPPNPDGCRRTYTVKRFVTIWREATRSKTFESAELSFSLAPVS
eukprot:2858487-Prymnesium_polylepis.1